MKFIQLIAFLTLMASAVSSAPSKPTGDDYRKELVEAGLSTQAIDGIFKISEQAYQDFSKFEKPSFRDAIETVSRLYIKIDVFLKTQSKEDQKAYEAYSEKKKEEYKD